MKTHFNAPTNFSYRGSQLVKCQECGAKISTPQKTWSLSRRSSQKGQARLMGLYECPECKFKFRSALSVGENEIVTIKNVADKIKVVKGEFMQTLNSLQDKIKTLEAERASLLLEIEELKKMAESKASALESEVSMLRDEVKSLRELLGCEETDFRSETKK